MNLTFTSTSLLHLYDNLTNTTTVRGPIYYGIPFTVAMATLAGLESLFTVAGNVVVLLSFFLERKIRQPSNYFIASLAVSDLLIGAVSIPFYAVYLLSGHFWVLGEILCDLWLSIDYSACLCSIYTVFFITLDRFCSVKIPARYRIWRTSKKILTIIAIIWLLPVIIFFTSIFGWQYFTGKRDLEIGECDVQYRKNVIFNTVLQIGYFWVTLVLMFGLYGGIYMVVLRLQKKSEVKRQKIAKLVNKSSFSRKNHESVIIRSNTESFEEKGKNGEQMELKNVENNKKNKQIEDEEENEISSESEMEIKEQNGKKDIKKNKNNNNLESRKLKKTKNQASSTSSYSSTADGGHPEGNRSEKESSQSFKQQIKFSSQEDFKKSTNEKQIEQKRSVDRFSKSDTTETFLQNTSTAGGSVKLKCTQSLNTGKKNKEFLISNQQNVSEVALFPKKKQRFSHNDSFKKKKNKNSEREKNKINKKEEQKQECFLNKFMKNSSKRKISTSKSDFINEEEKKTLDREPPQSLRCCICPKKSLSSFSQLGEKQKEVLNSQSSSSSNNKKKKNFSQTTEQKGRPSFKGT